MAWVRPYLVIVNVTIAGIVESAVAADRASRLPKAASPHQPVAVIIARDDLAMEVGTERLSEAQEEPSGFAKRPWASAPGASGSTRGPVLPRQFAFLPVYCFAWIVTSS